MSMNIFAEISDQDLMSSTYTVYRRLNEEMMSSVPT